MTIRFPSSSLGSITFVLAGLLSMTNVGCAYFRTLGSGSHMDAEHVHPVSTDHRTRTVQVEVTTDAQGEVTNVAIVHSSGKPGLDGYVVETVRQNWPKQPSARTLAEVSYSHDNGFSEPKLLSSTPVP